MAEDSLFSSALAHLEALVAFDTTSSKPNIPLLEYAAEHLASAGAKLDWVHAGPGKASLIATLGPVIGGGVLLSGHTDVVPVDGQDWKTDPWTLSEPIGGKLYGRGTSDMKSFAAIALALAGAIDTSKFKRPIMLALSHDEEVGCLGAPALVEALRERHPAPEAVIVGEPTSMELVTAHKGALIFRIVIRGHEAHSSLTHLGASAIMAMAPIIAAVRDLADNLAGRADPGSPFRPKGTSVNIGMLEGGTACNILARECSLVCDVRSPDDALPLVQPIVGLVEKTKSELAARFPDTDAAFEILCDVPALKPDPDGDAARLIRSLTGDNSAGRAVAYGAEAGYFQKAGYSTAMCGPGSIDQAHQPNEFIEVEQLRQGCVLMKRLSELCAQ